ncbi:MAG: zf-HC2 domain-containing protein [Oscillospiraceae bacterium]
MSKVQNSESNMDCKNCSDLLYDFVSDTLNKNDSKRINAHLSTCPKCQKEFAEINQMINVLANIPMIELPKDFNKTLHSELLKAADEIKVIPKEKWYENLVTRFKDFVVSANWRVAAPALIACVLVISVFSTGLYRSMKDADDNLGAVQNVPITTAVPTTIPSATENTNPPPTEDGVIVATAKPGVLDEAIKGNSKPVETAKASQKTQTSKPKQTAKSSNNGNNNPDDNYNSEVKTPSISDENVAQKPVETSKPVNNIQVTQKPNATENKPKQDIPVMVENPQATNSNASENQDQSAYSKNADDAKTGNDSENGKAVVGSSGSEAPTSTSVKEKRVARYSIDVANVGEFLKGSGYGDGSGEETSVTLTLSRTEFNDLKSYALSVGASVTTTESGDGDTVIVTIN